MKKSTGAFLPGADQLTVKFNERTEQKAVNQLVISGLRVSDFKSIMGISAPTIYTPARRALLAAGTIQPDTTVWGQTGTAALKAINSALLAIDSALVTVRQSSQAFGTNSSLLQIRADFTSQIINTLKGGAADLVNADMNEESANLLSLQTRQQLGTISLSIAQKSEEAILRLF